ncbi:TonB-dependent receptor [Roseibacterium beibuensis]|uniref:TonB-dependent receptor n=1 Tax=[Roseibacterium] beibuensis TaxID=1193142 RepID=UPI00217DECA1|nr:TonB-dependent receptor [Roseibacterium beibuensis]MCS6624521.1 TonB-dependent receptor [Roseibacterium beibuensis]
MTNAISFRNALLGGAAIVAAATPSAALAQAVAFSIEPQTLAEGLQEFARQTDREILYAPELVANRRTAGVSGSFTPEAAMQRLLAGTNLTFRQTGGNVIVLQAAGAPAGAGQAATQRGVGAGAIRGAVTDATTGSPVPGASIRIQGSNLAAVSDERGFFRIPGVPAGEHTVVLDYLGSSDQAQQVTVAAGGEATLNFLQGEGGVLEVEDVVVTGYMSAIQRALNQQRTANNASTVVSEDSLGGFPAETVSEALRRVPGVAFQRADDTGEGSEILVRGFSSEAINVQVNGADLQGTNFERTVDLSGYLADNISQVTIHKSLLPSHEATGSGGLVEIETRSGLDYGDFFFSAGAEQEQPVESGFGDEYQINATVGGKLTSTFGIAANVSYRDTSRRNFDVFNNSSGTTPGVLPAGYTSIFLVPASQQFPFDEGIGRLNTSATYIGRDREETNLAVGVNAAWDIGDHTRLRFDLSHNKRDAYTFFSRSAVQFLTGGFDMPIPELGGEVRRRFVFNSLRPGLSLAESNVELETNTLTFRGDTNVDQWQFRYKAGYSGATSRSSNNDVTLLGSTFTNLRDLIDPNTIEFGTDDDAAQTERIIGGAFVEGPDGVPIPSLTPLGMDILFDPATYRILSAGRSITDSPTDSYFGELSARRYMQNWIDYIEVGAKYDRSERTALDDTFTTDPASLREINSFSPIAGRNTFLSDLDPGLLQTRDLGLFGLNGFAVPSISQAGNSSIFRGLEDLLVDDPSTAFNEARFVLTDASDFDPALVAGGLMPASSVEARWAGYVEGHFEFGDFDIIGGARIERINRSGGTIAIPSVTLNTPTFQQEPRSTFAQAGMIEVNNVEAVETTVTPSFLINYRPRSNVVARLGYFRSTVHPSLQLLRRPTQYLIDLRPTQNRAILAEGNPDLEPTMADNWDLDVAWYFKDTPGLLRAAVFHKTITNNFTNVFSADVPADEVRDRILDYFTPLAATRPDLTAFNADTEFLYRRPENGEGGTIWGFELEAIRQFDFLPGFLSDFGFIGNVTYTAGDFPTLVSGRDDNGALTTFSLDRPLQDQAAWTYNAGLTYAKGGFEGRLVYTKQSESVSIYEVHDMNTVVPAFSTLDLRASYAWGGPEDNRYTVFLEGDDLLRDADEADIRSATSNTPGRSDASFFYPNTYQYSGGRTVTLGLRARF